MRRPPVAGGRSSPRGWAIDAPPRAIAGTHVDLGVRVDNRGPGVAEFPVALFATSPETSLSPRSGCSNPETPLRRCRMPAATTSVPSTAEVRAALDPFLREPLLAAAAVDAETVETAPGDEIDVASVSVFAQADLGVALVSEVPEREPDGSLAWTLVFDNHGPSGVFAPQVTATIDEGPSTVECEAIGAATCPAGDPLAPASGWSLRVRTAGLSEDKPRITLRASIAAASGEVAIGDRADSLLLIYDDALFADGVEAAAR